MYFYIFFLIDNILIVNSSEIGKDLENIVSTGGMLQNHNRIREGG